MIKWLLKKAVFCILLLALFCYLNDRNPDWMQDLGRWIGGEVGNRASTTVSGILEKAGESTGLSQVVEVFREEN